VCKLSSYDGRRHTVVVDATRLDPLVIARFLRSAVQLKRNFGKFDVKSVEHLMLVLCGSLADDLTAISIAKDSFCNPFYCIDNVVASLTELALAFIGYKLEERDHPELYARLSEQIEREFASSHDNGVLFVASLVEQIAREERIGGEVYEMIEELKKRKKGRKVVQKRR